MDLNEEVWRKYFTPVVSSRLHRPHSISFTPAPGSPFSKQCTSWDPQSQQSPPHRCEGEHRCNTEGIHRVDSNFFPNDSPESQTLTPQPQSPVANANDNEPEATDDTEPESSVTEPEPNDNDNELRKFIKNILKKQEDIFNKKLDEQNKTHTRQIQQLKHQLQQSFRNEIIQISNNLPPAANVIIHEEIEEESTKVNKKQDTKNKTATNKTQTKTNNTKIYNSARGSTGSNRKLCEIPPPSNYNQKKPQQNAIVVGDSIIKQVKGRRIRNTAGKYLKVCSYPGATSAKITDHSDVELKYSSYKTAIIHAGSNDLFQNIRGDDIVQNIAHLGAEMKEKGVQNIAISGLTPIKSLKWQMLDLNHRLKQMCAATGFTFIDNGNINFFDHVCWDKTHLNFEGVNVLEGNFARYLKNLEYWE